MKLFLSMLIVLMLVLLTLRTSVKANPYQIFCYWNTTAVYRKGYDSFEPWHIDTRLCSHLAYGYIRVNEKSKVTSLDENVDIKMDFLGTIERLKRGSKIKILASIDSSHQTTEALSIIAGDMQKRDRFFTSLIEFLRKWHFDGVDLRWSWRPMKNKPNFLTLLQELKIIMEEHKLLLSVAVPARMDANLDIPKIVKYADLINLMLHDEDAPKNSHRLAYSTRLYGGANSIERSVQHWVKLSGGADKNATSKLLLGIPFFGQSYTLANPQNAEIGAGSRGPGIPGNATGLPGYMGYFEFCDQATKWRKQYDDKAKIWYAQKGDQWLTYDDARSIFDKLHLLQAHKLGGASIFTIDADDYRGKCGERHSLLRVVNSEIGDPDAMRTPVTTTEGNGLCPQNGLFRHPWECSWYYECRDGRRSDYECSDGFYFDEERKSCQVAKSVKCDQDFVVWKPGMPLYNAHNMPVNLKISA